jgi:tripartite-type tricarboxylate transporter receptor subunit TctC
MMRVRTLAGATLATVALMTGAPGAAFAQTDYPNRSVKIVVPLPPGAAADTIPRIVADKLSARWRQPVVIENKPGAAQNLGAELVARAEPDGYTLLAGPPGPLAFSGALFPRLGFDPAAFVPVTVLATLPYVMVVNPKVPVTSVRELVAYAKANPDKLNYGSPGNGSAPQLVVEWFKSVAGIRMTHVPYRGAAPAMTDLLAGHIDLMIDNLGNALGPVRDGKLRALAVADAKRISELPDVPTIADAYPGFVTSTWFAIVAPPKTPAGIADALSVAMNAVLRMPDVVRHLRDLGATPAGSTPAATAAFIRRETGRWTKVIKDADIRPE